MYVARYALTLWKIARPRTLLLIVLQALLGYMFLTNAQPRVGLVVLSLVVIICAYMHAVAVNDISDEIVDKLNQKQLKQDNDRPLLDKTVTTRQLWWLAHGIALVWLIASIAISWQLLAATLVLLLLNFVYSMPPFQLSYRGGLAQLLLPLMYVGYPLYIAALLAGGVNLQYWLLASSLYVAFVGRLFLKDIRDEKGDASVGKRTFLVRHGLGRTLLGASICIIIGLLGIAVALTLQFGVNSLPLVSLGASVGVVVVAYFCYRSKDLSLQLLDVAMIGRLVSAVVFLAVIVASLSFVSLPFWQEIMLQLMAVAIFIFGIIGLQEEKRTIKK